MRSILAAIGLICVFAALPARAQIESIEDFSKHAETSEVTLDYAVWGTFLDENVFYNGMSSRRPGRAAGNMTGSRIRRGHGGRYSDEGNRVAFSLMRADPEAITVYREGLERVSSEIDFTQLSRDAQLCFWFNLHNVALIEKLAYAYPRTRIEERYEEIFEDKFLTVAGVPLSLNDIRLRIVYENWRDKPYVIYGFWHGVIGGPSIQPQAFTPNNLYQVMAFGATEFINSLRGVDRLNRRTLDVSRIYEEARPYFFADWPDDLKNHLLRFAQGKVAKQVRSARVFRTRVYDWSIADLVNEDVTAPMSEIAIEGADGVTRMPGRLLPHGQDFVDRSIRRQERMARERQGSVTIIDIDERPKRESDEKDEDG